MSKTKKKSKAIINTYPTVYGIDLVVANKHATLEQLNKLYSYDQIYDLDDEIIEAQATTSRVVNRKTDRLTILVKHNTDDKCKDETLSIKRIELAAHEAAHAILMLYRHSREEIDTVHQEPFAYLLAWIVICIYKTFNEK